MTDKEKLINYEKEVMQNIYLCLILKMELKYFFLINYNGKRRLN